MIRALDCIRVWDCIRANMRDCIRANMRDCIRANPNPNLSQTSVVRKTCVVVDKCNSKIPLTHHT